MLYYALIALAVVATPLVLFLIVVAMQPSQFRIERKAKIAALPATVFGHVNDLHKWASWSPWEKLDPELKRTYDGAASGKGAQYAWSGNNKVGQGKMTIVESRPSELIRIQLEFIRPFTATNMSEFTFQPEGNQTNVTWSMTGSNNFMAKAFGLLMNMDKLVGSDFEKGLAGMKAVAEAPAT